MASSTKFQKLMEPGYIGKVRTRNRIIKTGAGTGLHNQTDGYMNERGIGFYEAIARGGVGLIIVAQGMVDFPYSSGRREGYRIDDDEYIPSFSELTKVIHKYNCPAFIQMFHSGPMRSSQFLGIPPVAASSLSKSEMPRPQFEVAKELSISEIEDLVEKFAKAAVRAQKAGFDGIEINASHSHLFNSFLSRAWNKRHDAYGCADLKSRSRFVVEIIKEIKRRNGQDFPVTVLINGAEYLLDKGITPEESQGIARIFQDAGVDAIHIRGEVYVRAGGVVFDSVHFAEAALYPELREGLGDKFDASHKGRGGFVPLAAATKKAVSIPVITVSRLDAELGEEILRQGKADFIAMNRRLLADPELPNKISSQRPQDIAPCMACDYCFDNVARLRQPLQCRVNAALGKEREYSIKPAEHKKKVMVVGGGPAGMEAARVAALRGHEVILYEKESKLGGLIPLAAVVKGTEIEDLPALAHYLITQITKAGVEIKLGEEVSPSLIQEIKPDVCILATGGTFTVPEVPGINRRNVVNSHTLHRKMKVYLRFFSPNFLSRLTKFWLPIGKEVVIMGGAISGCELAEFLVKRGRKVTIVDTANEMGNGLVEMIIKHSLLGWLDEKGVTMMTEVKYEEITDRGLIITTKEGERKTIEADTIVPAIPLAPNNELLQNIEGFVSEVYPIGDCKEPRLILEAIADGSRIARSI